MSKDQIEEFGKCFEELEAPLIAYAYQILREREDARDQVQEAFKRMILQEEPIKQPKAWLYRTVRNLCISHLRKHQRMQKEGEEKQLDFFAGKFDTSDDNNTPIEKLERTEKINRVLHFISLLPEDARTLIKMKFEEKLCYREISQKTGLTEGNVGYKLHHLLRSLAEELKSEGIIA